MKENFVAFILRHKFRLTDIAGHRPLTLHDYRQLTQVFPGMQWLWLELKRSELERLGKAMAIAGYMAKCETDEPELFSRVASELRDDEWRYVLGFCPYDSVQSALTNLELILSAMEEACLGLNAAKAGMETAIEHTRSSTSVYSREQSKATAQLLNFTALYASYIDTCRRIRRQCGLDGNETYDRAIKKVMGVNTNAHSFTKDLRNFTLHYKIPEPSVTIHTSDHRSVALLLKSGPLLYSGFRWKSGSIYFLQSAAEFDVLETSMIITRDVRRLVEFHKRIASKRLSEKKYAYETYLYERERYRTLRDAMTDIGAAFNRPTSLMSRLLDPVFVDRILGSALSDSDAEKILIDYANRHQNLPKDVLDSLRCEVRRALMRRPRYPIGGPYLSQRKFE